MMAYIAIGKKIIGGPQEEVVVKQFRGVGTGRGVGWLGDEMVRLRIINLV